MHWVICRADGDIRSNQHTFADGDFVVIDQCQIRVDKRISKNLCSMIYVGKSVSAAVSAVAISSR